MPLTEPDFASIANLVRKIVREMIGTRRDYFITGKVVKVNKADKCVFMKEFGDQPIPIVSFDYDVEYYDTDNTGAVKKRTVKTKVHMPKVGDTIFVAKEMGTSRMPRCLGVIQGKNWIIPEAE